MFGWALARGMKMLRGYLSPLLFICNTPLAPQPCVELISPPASFACFTRSTGVRGTIAVCGVGFSLLGLWHTEPQSHYTDPQACHVASQSHHINPKSHCLQPKWCCTEPQSHRVEPQPHIIDLRSHQVTASRKVLSVLWSNTWRCSPVPQWVRGDAIPMRVLLEVSHHMEDEGVGKSFCITW